MQNKFILKLAGMLFMMFVSHTDVWSQVSGTVYQDFNGNGTKDNTATFNEVGLAGVTVTATNPGGASLTVTYTGGGSSTNSTGGYSVTGGTLGQIRLEFVLPDGHTFASRGSDGGTTIMFPATAIQNLGVFYPGNYVSNTNPRVATQQYTNGNNQVSGSTSANWPSIRTFPHDNGAINDLSSLGSVGATWGLAYHKSSGKLYSAAFAKRHVNTGTLGLSGIYVTPNAQTENSLTATQPFVNLNAVNPAFDAGTVTRNFTPGGGVRSNPNYDEEMFDKVGKVGLGGLAVSDNGQYLYVVNLNDRRLWRVEVGANGEAPTAASQVVQYPALPQTCTEGTFRPFAVEYYKGDIYVGGVCDGVNGTDATSPVSRSNLKATIFKVDASLTPSASTFSQVLNVPLDYNRKAGIYFYDWPQTGRYYDPNNPTGVLGVGQGSWHPWTRSWNDLTYARSQVDPNTTARAYPQPMLMGLTFDVDGSLVMGFGDRFGNQVGHMNYGAVTSSTSMYHAISAGDIMRAYNNNGTYQIENNGAAGPITTSGLGNGQGPGGGEFYYHDRFTSGSTQAARAADPLGLDPSANSHMHDETALGGVALLAGRGSVLTTSYDPRTQVLADLAADGVNTGGIRWYSNSTGRGLDGITMYNASSTGNFGKASGIGDLELMVDAAPIEIGNRVWLDSNNNGIQDAGEGSLPGITVTLYAADGTTVLGTATTNAQGEYYFSSAAGTSTGHAIYNVNIQPNTDYVLSFPTSSGVHTLSSKPNTGLNDLIDTDADAEGKIRFTTGDSGQNDHSFDVGYYTCPTVTRPEISDAGRCGTGTISTALTVSCTTGYTLHIFSDETLTTDVTGSFTISSDSVTSPSLSGTTTYYAVCSDTDCESEKSEFVLAVNAAPAITVNSPTICTGETATLTVDGCTGGVVTWSGGLTGSPATTPILTADQTYTATCTDANGCKSTAVATVTITSAPAITVNSPTICAGETATLTVDGCVGGTITWTGGLTGSPATTPTLTADQTYTATCTDANGCTSTAVATVTITSAPAITVNSPAICAGETATLTVDGCVGGTITWTGGLTGNPATTLALTSDQTYIATCTIGTCVSTVEATVTVTSVPGITVNSPTICSGETATLTVNGCVGGTITWTDGLTGSPATTPALTSGQTYIATCTIGTCTSTVEATVTVTTLAIVVNSPSICAGTTATLTVTGCEGGTVTWSGGLTDGISTTTGILTNNQTYTATCTDTNGCVDEAVATVTVGTEISLSVQITGSAGGTGVCTGDSATLTITGCEGGQVTWTDGLSGNPAVTPALTSNQTYTATCTVGADCIETLDVTVIVSPLPLATAEAISASCNGVLVNSDGRIVLSGFETTDRYSYSEGSAYTGSATYGTADAIPANGIIANTLANPTTAKDYTIRVYNEEECYIDLLVTLEPAICKVFDLALRKTLATGQSRNVQPGDQVTFTITVFNQGNVEAQNIQVTDYIPTGLTLAPTSGWTVTAGKATLANPIATLAAEDSTKVNITFTVNADVTGQVTNLAEISGADNQEGLEDIDSTPDNDPDNDGTPKDDVIDEDGKNGGDEDDHDPETITVNPEKVFDLALRKTLATGQSRTVQPGDEVTFTITVYNQGNVEAQNIQVTDYVPADLTLTGSAWTETAGKATLNTPIASLAAGDSVKVNITFTVNDGVSGPVINLAEISSADNDENLEDIDSTPDDNPDNDGTPKDDVIDEDGKNGGDEDDHDPETINVTPEKVFDLALRKTLATGQSRNVQPGDQVTFTITVYNQGNVEAQNIQVTDYIPAGLTLAPTSGWTVTGGKATLANPIATLAAEDSTKVNITFTVNADVTGQVTNLAEISGADNQEGLEDIDSTPDDNPGNDGTPKDDVIDEDGKNNPGDDEDDHDPETITVNPEKVFDLALRKTLATGQSRTVQPGDEVTFTITVYNQGNVEAQNIQVTDYIPAGLTLAPTSGWTVTAGKATLANPIATLAAEDSTKVNITFTVNADVTGQVTNLAEISGADNQEGLEDIDSTPDNDPSNDGTPKDDEIDEDGKNNPGDDEDDHDPETITVTEICKQPLLSVHGDVDCNDGGDWSFTVSTNGTLNIPSGVTLNGTKVTVPASMSTVSITSTSDCGAITEAITVSRPVCPPANCVEPVRLSVGTPLAVCTGITATYSVSFVSNGTVTVNAGTVGTNVITDIPLGTDVVITSTKADCGTSVMTVSSPDTFNCTDDVCDSTTPELTHSVICNGDGTYTIYYTAQPGVTVVSSAGGFTNLTGPVTLTITNTVCSKTSQVYILGPDCVEKVFDLALRKTMAPGSKTIYKVGDVVTFNITVFNQGTVAATSVDLVDYIPTGLSLQDNNWTLDGDKARWIGAITDLAAGADSTVSISFVVNSSATGVIINTAEISGATNPEGLEDIDSTPDDDKDNDGPVKNDEINEDGKNGGDEDDHDIEPITICPDAKCLNVRTIKNK